MNSLDQLKRYQTVSTTPPVPDCVDIFAKIMGHSNDYVERIDTDEEDGICRITFGWSARGCSQHDDYEVPIDVLTSENPHNSIMIWKLTQSRNEAKYSLEQAERDFKSAQTAFVVAENTLSEEKWKQERESK